MGVTGTSVNLRDDLAHLDEAARLPNGGETDGHVVALVEQVAGLPGGLDELVTRYATARNALVPRSVSFGLARLASKPSTRSWALTREFVAHARATHDASTMINVLTAVQRHLGGDPNVFQESPEPDLAAFILRCLEQPALVRSQAVDLLVGMAVDGVLRDIFPPASVVQLRRVIDELGRAGGIAERDQCAVLAALGGNG